MERLTVKEIIPALINTGVAYLSPERKKLANGRKSCLYFNVGDLVISHPNEKALIVEALAQTYRDSGIESDRLAGVPEGANCLVSSLSDRLRVGQLRIREEIVDHGDQRSIEGRYNADQTVTVFEDVMSSGKSIEKRALNPLVAAGLKPNMVIAFIDREFGGVSLIRDRIRIPVLAFTTITEIAQ